MNFFLRLSFILCCFLFAFVAQTSSVSANDLSKIRLACNEFPPQKMAASPNGLPGYDVEILRQAFLRSGVKVKIEFMPWKRALEHVRRGRQDGLCSCSRQKNRDQWLSYSEQMGTVGVGYFYKAHKLETAGPDWKSLQEYHVGVVRGYNLESELEQEGISAFRVNQDRQGLGMLLKNRIDAFVTFRDTGKYILSNLPQGSEVKYKGIRESAYYACFNKSLSYSDEALKKFNSGLADLRKDGTFDRIMAKYR